MQKIQSCLWFNDQAEQAVQFYASLFGDSKIGKTVHYSGASAKGLGQKEGSVMTVECELFGCKFMALNGGPNFKFTPALSNFVWCDSETEIDRLWLALSEKGEARMGLGAYPWSQKYGWTADRYGVEWQIMLSDKRGVAPAFLFVDKLFGKGGEAIEFYMSVFGTSQAEVIARDDASNTIMHCVFSLEGSKFVLMEGKGEHGYTFSGAYSLIVHCNTQEEIDYFWSKLSYDPAAERCGWLQDKYGVSWQIVPAILTELISDHSKFERVMNALLQMKKLDIEKLKQA